MERVWREVEGAGPEAGHDAHFVCALAIAWPNDGQAENFEGRVDGTLTWPPRGDKGFGYDPMFVPERPRADVRRDGSGGKARASATRRRLPEAGRRKRSEVDRRARCALYVHWPFCVSKCPYCDFNSHVRSTIDQDEWRDALLADLAHEAQPASRTHADLDLLRRRHAVADGAGNGRGAVIARRARIGRRPTTSRSRSKPIPNSVEAARFADLAAAGVNRLSLGLQSFDDASLAFLGRAHSADEGQRALDIAQAALSARQLRPDLRPARRHRSGLVRDARSGARRSAPSHLSLYQLTIEPGTRFASMVAKHEFEPLDGDAAASLYELTAERTAAAGIPAYEISNHARAGQESRHNLTYWRYGDYAGVGPGAHGRRLGKRTVRHRKPENFLSGIRPQRPRHGRGGNALSRRSGGRGAGHGAAPVRRRGPAGSCQSVRKAGRRRSCGRPPRCKRTSGTLRKTGYARRRPVGCCSTAFLRRLRRA